MRILPLNQIICGDSLETLKGFPDESVDCVITSPPYYGLRDYGTAKWEGGNKNCSHEPDKTSPTSTLQGGKSTQGSAKFYKDVCPKCSAKRIDLQIGLELTYQEFINNLCRIFDEVKRVLKKEGTCFVNLGDTYSGNKNGKTDNKVSQYLKDTSTNIHKKATITEKSLCQIPSHFAIEMAERNWILRNEIIWYKPNAMPSSAEDRFSIDFEKVFFFVKQKRYYFEQQFEKSLYAEIDKRAITGPSKGGKAISGNYSINKGGAFRKDGMKNKRCVWEINTHGYSEAHFATFPEKLIEPMVLAGCPKGGIILDPFGGAMTTCVVAKKLGRNFLAIELNPKYIEIGERRLAGTTPPML